MSETSKILRDAGYHDEADRIEAVTAEDKAAFEEWLNEDDNRKRWDDAIAQAAERLLPSTLGHSTHKEEA